MKIKMNTRLLIVFSALLLWTACSTEKKQDTEEMMHLMSSEEEPLKEPTEPHFKTSEVFRKQVGSVFVAYTSIQKAFVASDLNAVKSAGQKMGESLAGVNHDLLEGAAHMDWNGYSEQIITDLSQLAVAPDLAQARQIFSALTEHMYKAIKAFGIGGQTAFYSYCPMAFNNKGGYWLSNEKKIRNPYFGNQMLECGAVREQLK